MREGNGARGPPPRTRSDRRRLAAIMFTDMVGFSTIAQRNENLALRLLEEYRTLLRPLIGAHGGRIVKTMGDGLLVEFPSAVESVICARKIQDALSQRNATAGPGEKISLRIGIHVGDILDQGDDIVGDAVNIASRLEPLAEPGGICVSEQVIDQIRNKVPIDCQELVAPSLKNIETPVHVYRVQMQEAGEVESTVPSIRPAYIRVAVLPFASLSSNPADEEFADGLTEELINHLAQSSALRVVARTSVMQYKRAMKGIREIGRELSVGSILEGSVRRSANTLRVTVQLVDSGTEENLWAQRFDRELTDSFAIQDEIAQGVSTVLQGKLVTQVPPALRYLRPGPTPVRRVELLRRPDD
jgi:adenylate cyclase